MALAGGKELAEPSSAVASFLSSQECDESGVILSVNWMWHLKDAGSDSGGIDHKAVKRRRRQAPRERIVSWTRSWTLHFRRRDRKKSEKRRGINAFKPEGERKAAPAVYL